MELAERQAGVAVDFSPMARALKAELYRQVSGGIKTPRTLSKDEWKLGPDYEAVLAWRQNQVQMLEDDPNLLKAARGFYANNHAAFINHWCDTYDPRNAATGQPVWMPLVLFQRQEELCNFVAACVRAQASGLVEKSRDMGATWVCAGISVAYFLFGQPAAIGWGSQTKDKVDRLGDPSSVFEKLRMMINRLPSIFKPRDIDDYMNFMRIVNPETGATIVGEIGDDIGRGGRTGIYFVDEAAHLARPEKVEAALLDNTRTRIDISSVSGLGTVFYRKREAGVDWLPGQEAVRNKTNVFVMDWRDHPLKNEDWYNDRRVDLESKGLSHVFAQEIDRNYAAAVEGVIIPAEWVVASIDSHVKLGLEVDGQARAGLDVADGGGDTNALATGRGPVVMSVEEWAERDTGVTARRAASTCMAFAPIEVQYDALGVGSGIKAETNRLVDEKILPRNVKFIPWMASATPNHPNDYLIPRDPTSPKNKAFFANLKAQAWWALRRRFELTFQVINNVIRMDEVDPDELISLPSSLPRLRKLQQELSQATVSRKASTLKLVVDKSPEGTKSPNLADALVMAYWPVQVAERHLALGGITVLRQR